MSTTTSNNIGQKSPEVKESSAQKTTKSIFNTPVSLLTDIYKPDRLDTLTIDEALNRIQAGTYKTLVEQARRFKDTERAVSYEKKKKKLPAMTFVGTFRERRANTNFQEHSGFAIIDLDDVDNLSDVKDRLCDDKHVAACFISPGGQGLKLLVRIPHVKHDAEYKRILPLLAAYYKEEYDVDINFGKDGKDVSRLCFVSYDPELYRNENAVVFPVSDDVLHPLEPEQKIQEPSVKESYRMPTNGDREGFKKAVIETLQEKGSHCFDDYGNFLEIAFACKAEGLDYTLFDSIVCHSDNYNPEQNRVIYEKLQPKSITFGTAYDYAEKIDPDTLKEKLRTYSDNGHKPGESKQEPSHPGPDPEQAPPPQDAKPLPNWCFWTYDYYKTSTEIKSTVKVSASKYLEFLTGANFRIFMKRGTPVVVRETVDSMEKTGERGRINTDVKQYVLEKLTQDGYPEVIDALLLNSKYFTLDVLEMLPEIAKEKARHSLFSQPDAQVNLLTPLVNENPLIAHEDTPLLSPGEIMGIVGLQGQGKSGICELIASLTIDPNCEPECPFTIHTNGGLTLWIDTERTKNDVIRTLKRIARRTKASEHNFLTDDGEHFQNLVIKRCAERNDDRMTWLLQLLDDLERPVDLLIIDGALDMVESMNDENEAKHFFADLQHIASEKDCGVILTVHSGSTDETGKGMGHVGGIIQRKCSAFLQIRNVREDRSIKELTTDFHHAKVRSGRDWGIYAALQWSEYDNMLHFIDYTPPDQPEKTKQHDKIISVLNALFAEHQRFTHTALVNAYQETGSVSRSTAVRHIKTAKDDMNFLSLEYDFYVLANAWEQE